jgi:hypothetical protein
MSIGDELILTNYFIVRDGKIVSLIVIRNTPAYLGARISPSGAAGKYWIRGRAIQHGTNSICATFILQVDNTDGRACS